jgi:3'(2'), 5'-bisphosphate nucleotidase
MSPIELGVAAVSAARAAGGAIMPFYKTGITSVAKLDGSPLTAADQAAHLAIASSLAATGIPLVSEEAEEMWPDAERYWLVDPLDGTKDFLAQNDEFTVNIALVDRGAPVLGVVFAPALDELYFGMPGQDVWRESAGLRSACACGERSLAPIMAISRFHDHPDSEVFAQVNAIAERRPMGAALKYGRMAIGQIDVYPRMVGTSEWDTAAGQAILEAAGGKMLDWATGKPLLYGKPGRRNGRFVAFRFPYQASDFKLVP